MSNARPGTPGATRTCPHCKSVVLESAAVCPGCRHHLRFNTTQQTADEAYSALSLEGTLRHRVSAEACEYCIVVEVRDERGGSLVRQVVGVGALQPGERRQVSVAVDMLPVRAAVPAAKGATTVATPPRTPTPAAGVTRPAASVTGPPPSRVSAGTTAAKPAAEAKPAAPATPAAAPPLQPPRPGSPPERTGPLLSGREAQRLRIFRKP